MKIIPHSFNSFLTRAFEEDDLGRNAFYDLSLPRDLVKCKLKIKSHCTLAGLPFFLETFEFLGCEIENSSELLQNEGQSFEPSEISLSLPFCIALTGERIALNLLQRATSIATTTKKFTDLASPLGIEILCTRKTTPTLRFLEKYAVRIGGASNHRFGQADMWMIKDNHKSFFGSLEKALNFFNHQKTFYQPIIVEIHTIKEAKLAMELGVRHLLLDNFNPSEIQELVKMKKSGVTYEVSGGMTLDKLPNYLIEGIDAISVGALTHSPEKVDLSFKYE